MTKTPTRLAIEAVLDAGRYEYKRLPKTQVTQLLQEHDAQLEGATDSLASALEVIKQQDTEVAKLTEQVRVLREALLWVESNLGAHPVNVSAVVAKALTQTGEVK